VAASFEVVGSQVVPERLSPTEVVDRQRTYLRALPSNIVFPLDFKVGYTIVDADTAELSVIANKFNDAWRVPGVLDIVVNEDTDSGGYINLTFTTYVQSTSARSTTQFTMAYSAINSAAWRDRVEALVAGLDAQEAV
jgi:hypothetical protein